MHVSPALVTLQTLIFITDSDTHYCKVDDFLQILNTSKSKSGKVIRKFNLWKEIQNYHYPSVKTIDDNNYLSFESVIKYCFNHAGTNEICQKVCKEVTDSLLLCDENDEEVIVAHEQRTTILELYKRIAENSLFDSDQLDELQADILSLDIPSLYACYREEFQQLIWNKICVFEWHFHFKHPDGFVKIEDEVKAKWAYYDQCVSSEKLSTQLRISCNDVIERNKLRREASACINSKGCEVFGVLHSFGQLEKAATHVIYDVHLGNSRTVCLQCGDDCKSQLGVHIFVELTTDIGDVPKADLQDIAFLLQKELADKHKLSLHEVVFLVPKTLDSYKCANCPENNFHRYELFHALVGKKLLLAVIHVSTFVTDADEDQPESRESTGKKYCKECTNDVKEWIQYPLDWMSFSLFREWHLFLPLPIQILFSGLFLNKRSLTRSLDSQQFFHKRIQRLYCLLDIGLNTLNQKHCGILPEMNSVELLFNHRSASTVFSLTNEMGISQSLKTSSKWLQTESDGDNCFFKTFIKKYTLMYQRIFEEDISSSSVGMKDCFVILGLDNLVRLTTHTDPNPGENRTSQLCTIPMTLKGLPRDCSLVASWHKPDCDAEPGLSCECMERNQLEVGSNNLLFKLLPCEQAMQSKFDVQSTWGLSLLWSDIREFITRNIDDESRNIGNLNQTMESLNLGDDTPMQEEILPQGAPEELGRRPGENNEIPIQEEQISKSHAFESDVIVPTQSTADEFPVFPVPPLLTRHPRPAIGRDDDKAKLREILMEILQSLGRYPNNRQRDRILLAPDHKLSKNLILLMKEEAIFRQFLPEFPVLHLKKSKILNLFSAYKNAGLHELLQYMKDDEHEKDWKKLITFHNIETAAKNIKRLALAFHIAFLTNFITNLPHDEKEQLLKDMESSSVSKMETAWTDKYEQFMTLQASTNATFALHEDMMKHCDEIAAICLAERIGGPNGYNLMLSAVKRSLPFAFLNGASSYATFCVELLHEHYTAGVFHKQLKASLFTTPHQGSSVNIALDTQREMDHRDALKAFRPGAALTSIIPKMSIVDTMVEITKARKSTLKGSLDNTDRSFTSLHERKDEEKSFQGMAVTKKDLQHVLPTAELILRRKGLEKKDTKTPCNVYREQEFQLSEAVLDQHSYGIGQFLAHRYCFTRRLFTVEDEMDISQVEGCQDLKRKLRQSKGLTIKRTSLKPNVVKPSEIQKREERRKTDVKKHIKYVECWSSKMNTCQAVVKPDCSKASVPKACGMRNALFHLLSYCNGISNVKNETHLQEKGLVLSNCKAIPRVVSESITTATVEFAGIKFKTTATSGKQYLLHVQNGIIRSLQKQLPNLKRLIICEEKYRYTPDDFKAATRANRQKKILSGISHLKLSEDVVSAKKLSKPAIRETANGKRLISSYLASNARMLDLSNITVDIDSELFVVGCTCEADGDLCKCNSYTKPKRVIFDENGFKEEYFLDVRQRKGEAEMAQIDWFADINLEEGEAVLSVVTSGDIDSVSVHLFGIPGHWPRQSDGKYKNSVYVLLQKPKPDLYNITAILESLETYFKHPQIGQNVSLALCLGGNDFLPKFHGISHKRWMDTILKARVLPRLLISSNEIYEMDKDVYSTLVKALYCPPAFDSEKLSFQEVRDISIKPPNKSTRNPNLWMPPFSAIQQLSKLIDLQVQYLQTAWNHEAELPDFEGSGCLVKRDKQIELNLGPDVHCNDVSSLIQKSERELLTTMRLAKSQRKKRPCPETPDKQDRKRQLNSTPRRRRTLIPVAQMNEDLSDIEPLE